MATFLGELLRLLKLDVLVFSALALSSGKAMLAAGPTCARGAPPLCFAALDLDRDPDSGVAEEAETAAG